MNQYNLHHRWLTRVDLDLTGLCNKTCSFCPRYSKNYPNENIHMPLETIQIVLDELRNINFRGVLELAGRGESTLHREFEKVVEMVTAQPRTWTVRLTTNGYRIEKYWDNLYKKFDMLILNTYTTEEEFEKRKAIYPALANGKLVEHYFKPDGLSIQEINKMSGWTTLENPVNFRYSFNNRAGAFNDNGNNFPCWHPMRQIFIDYRGNYQLCCNDWKYQVKIGNVHERSLIDMYNNDVKLNRYRWLLINKGRGSVFACSKCDECSGGKQGTRDMIDKFKKTPEYRYVLLRSQEGLTDEIKREVSGPDLIPIFEEL